MTEAPSTTAEMFRLHVGGVEHRAGWKVLNAQPGPHVDFVGDCANLSRFADESVDQVYASHVYEHLDYARELPGALSEVHRILKPGGIFQIAVPDLAVLCRLFLAPNITLQQSFDVMRMMFGGQTDSFDYHKVGLNEPMLYYFLGQARFKTARRVVSFGLFQDCSTIIFAGQPISLNVEATK